MSWNKVLLAAAAASAVVILGGSVARADHPDPEPPGIRPVVTGLNNPRGVAVDGRGNLYVAEAGPYLGTDPNHETGDEHGLSTGRVTKWTEPGTDRQEKVWSTSFGSLYDNVNGIPEVLGPSGLSAIGNGCMDHSHGRHAACALVTIIGESARGVLAEDPGAMVPPGIGHLFFLNPGDGSRHDASDVGDQQYQWTDDHKDLWEEFPDANPYGVLITRGRRSERSDDWNTRQRRIFVADAGANTVSEIGPDGTTRVIAYVPNDGVRDSTPTCVAEGPDGALYVGTLNLTKNGFGQTPGQSDVWRIDPDSGEDFLSAAHLWATGLTTVTACAFDARGNFWATEMFQPNGPMAPPGDVVRIPFDDPASLTRIGGGQLPFPGGIAPARDGGLYVTINSLTFAPDSGAVVKLAAH
ncbi:MAG TPA: ScyD/ScyE family protein [Candidatus Polarisedimenticolia bacterium]|nr:ScyD/ScyE family protein [Candidatus Polarisedimenticolia bacterium]